MANTLTKITTNAGLALNAKIQAGTGKVPLPLTRVVADAGRADDLANLTAAVEPKLEFVFEKQTSVQSHAIIRIMLTNQGNPAAVPAQPPLGAGFSLNMMLWFAEDPDVGEILYQVFRFEIDPETGTGIPYVPAAHERLWTYNPEITITISDAGVVTIEILPNSLASRQSIWDSIEMGDTDMPSSGVRAHLRIISSVVGYTPFGLVPDPGGMGE